MKEKRRNLLKAITMGSGAITLSQLPATWSRPVVESVTLPAHAQTTTDASSTPRCSPCSGDFCYNASGEFLGFVRISLSGNQVSVSWGNSTISVQGSTTCVGGTFTVQMTDTNPSDSTAQVTISGTINPDCSEIECSLTITGGTSQDQSGMIFFATPGAC